MKPHRVYFVCAGVIDPRDRSRIGPRVQSCVAPRAGLRARLRVGFVVGVIGLAVNLVALIAVEWAQGRGGFDASDALPLGRSR